MFMRRILRFMVLSLAAGCSTAANAADSNEPLPWDRVERLPASVAGMMQDRRFAEAAKELEKLAAAAGAPSDRLLYGTGRAWTFAGKYDEAVAAFTRVEQEHPKSVWARRARFARGVSLAKKGDYASAELIYRAEAEHLLSHERKQELAEIYLGFARRLATPLTSTSPPDQPPPDYAKALQFFQQALELGPHPDARPEIEMRMAECHRLSGNYDESANRYARFVKDRPDHPRTPEARYWLGDCRLRQDRHVEARRAWQDLLALWPADKLPADKSQADFVARAAFDLARTYQLPNPTSDDDLAIGIAALQAFVKRFADHRLADEARLIEIQSLMARNRFAEAESTAHDFLADAKRSERPEAATVRHMLGMALRQQGKLDEAILVWREFLSKHPSHAGWSAVQQHLIETDYSLGAEAYRKKDYADARKLWTEFLIRYPLDPRSQRILFLFGEAELRQNRFEAAIEEWRKLISKYPATSEASAAQLQIGIVLEEKLGKPADAMQEYKKVVHPQHLPIAQDLLRRLTTKQLAIETERVFRTDESPRIKLRSRNVERVTVRVYKLDLETYFRKMHLASGVESLDLALIDPDRTFDFAVPEYAEFRPCESEIQLPGLADTRADAKPGVVAVAVSGQTQEATTLVIRSDLEVIVKGSRDEVFVFAQNMRTGKPWADARVLLSDGSEIIVEAATGKDGVFRASPERLKQSDDVRVFAESGGNTASNLVSLAGVGVAQSLEERGFLYTDRNGYRPGHVVHVRGVLRAVVDDRYVAVPKRKYRLETYDSRNRLIYSTDVTTGDFGSFHAYFALPAAAAPGEYRVQAADIDGRTFAGSFHVENYQVEPVRLVVDLPRNVYYRGEEIEGVIRAEFYYGTPLAGREIRYSLGDDLQRSGTTDEQGRVMFRFPTRDFREEQHLSLVAELPERNLYTSASLMLAVRAFSIGLSTPREVVTVGESFPLILKTNGADGKPAGQRLVAEVFEQMIVDGASGERSVEKHDVVTDDKAGHARLTLTLEKGGRYLVRVSGTDRFGNPIVASHQMFVSGDEDTVRLRILADVHNYRVGDEAVVRVHWREAPALALLTFQGSRILDYRLLELKKGDNLLKLPMGAHLAPNFFLEVNALTDDRAPATKERIGNRNDFATIENSNPRIRLHNASNQFFVERPLHVALEIKQKDAGRSPRPGESVDVVISTRDAQNRPIAAELSLAAIDQLNVDRFGEVARGFTEAFSGIERRPAMRTASSIDFAYRPSTQPINPRLLSEEQRLEIAAQEEDLRKSLAENTPQEPALGEIMLRDADGVVADHPSPESGRLAEDRRHDLQTDALNLSFDFNGGQMAAAAAKPQTPAITSPTAGGDLAGTESGRERQAGEKLGRGLRVEADGSLAVEGKPKSNLELLRENESESLGIDAARLSNESLDAYYKQGGRELTVVSDGVQANVYFGETFQTGRSEELIRRLKAEQAVVMAAPQRQETAYWNPAIVTDAQGTATVAVTLPERSTSWKLVAKGITVDALGGEADAVVTAKKDLFGELALPDVVTDGDTLQIAATIHDLIDRKPQAESQTLNVTLSVRIGDKSTEEKRTISSKKAGLHELTFAAAANLPDVGKQASAAMFDVMELTLAITAGDRRDVLRRSVAIRPYGYTIASATGGAVTSDTTAWVEQPANMTLRRPRLQIVVGARVDENLMNVLFGTDSHCGFYANYASPLEATTSDLLAALALGKYVATTRTDAATTAPQIAARIRAAVGQLVAAQRDDGSCLGPERPGKPTDMLHRVACGR